MIRNLKDDLISITGVSPESVDKVIDVCEDLVCQDVFESIVKGEQLTQVDIGIGDLYITRDGDLVKYKFIPNSEFDSKVRRTYRDRASPIIRRANKALKLKFDRAYKELI